MEVAATVSASGATALLFCETRLTQF